MREGDEVLVNVAAVELGLGSGGFDVVHANLTRGLDGDGREPVDPEIGPGDAPHVMKLNYTSLQHPVDPVEPAPPAETRGLSRDGAEKVASSLCGVLVLPLHGHLAPAVWAAAGGPTET